MANVMSKQEMFNRAVLELATQGFQQARTQGGSCLYEIQKPDGTVLRCAYSHAMTDSLRKKVLEDGMNGARAAAIIATFPEEAPYVDEPSSDFENDLQRTHDDSNSSTPDGMRDSFRRLAGRHGLQWPDVLKES